MSATIIPFPLIEGAFCAVLMSHPRKCACPNCRKSKQQRTYELELAEKVKRELDQARVERDDEERHRGLLEKHAL